MSGRPENLATARTTAEYFLSLKDKRRNPVCNLGFFYISQGEITLHTPAEYPQAKLVLKPLHHLPKLVSRIVLLH